MAQQADSPKKWHRVATGGLQVQIDIKDRSGISSGPMPPFLKTCWKAFTSGQGRPWNY